MNTTSIKGLTSDARTILAAIDKDDEGRFNVVCAEVDEQGRPCIGPAWHLILADLPDYRRAQPTVAEAWNQARPLLERLRKWGWTLLNADKQPIGPDGSVL
jgi:hypothetical protein